MTRLSRNLLLIALLLVLSAARSLTAQSARIDPRVAGELAGAGLAVACVCLHDTSRQGDPMELRAESFREVQDDFLAGLPASGIRVVRRYRYSPVVLVSLSSAASLTVLERSPLVVAVGPDAAGSGGLDDSRSWIHADEVFALGVTGAGRVAAVLDSGADTDHADLAAAIIHQHHILDRGEDEGPGAEDGHGHGTNVTGIIASRGTAAPRGVAPSASIVAVKILDDSNRGFLSDWAAGLEYIVGLHQAGTFSIDAVNMSLVSDASYTSGCDDSYAAFAGASQAAIEAGIAVFASSGNTGSPTRMTSPACLSTVISVGSSPDSLPQRVSAFTSRNGDLDLLAPGESIVSTGAGGATSSFTGTSQASPHAVAAACLLRQARPRLTPAAILGVLRATGVAVEDPGSGFTFPRIDVLAAYQMATEGPDCNDNGMSDRIDIEITGASLDLDLDGVPDECGPVSTPPFLRGDANASGGLELSDAVKTFLYLFSGDAIDCLESADADDSGRVDLSDGVYSLLFLFQGGKAIPAPGAAGCGLDPTPDTLTCGGFSPCAS